MALKRRIVRRISSATTYAVIRAWSFLHSRQVTTTMLVHFHPVYGFVQKRFLRQQVMCNMTIQTYDRQLKPMVDLDHAKALEVKAHNLYHASLENNSKNFWSLLRPHYKKATQAQTSVRAPDGQVVSHPAQIKTVMQGHFAKLLDANKTSMEQLLLKDRQMMCTNLDKQKDVKRDPALLMSQVDANQRYKATDISKQHGEDTLPGVLYKRFHHQLSQWFFVLMIKSSLLLHEPLKWRGCALAEL